MSKRAPGIDEIRGIKLVRRIGEDPHSKKNLIGSKFRL